LSRTAVWKAIRQLKADGYEIEAVTSQGYRLLSDSDVLSAEGIARYLQHPEIRPQVFPSLTSTNTVLKSLAAEDAPAGTAVLAVTQTAGRGRLGRSFYSPSASGLYLSLLLRPDLAPADAPRLTSCAAVAVAEAVSGLSGRETGIKWVNDVYMDGKKICGILTEAGIDLESGRVSYVVVGIGINLRAPEGGFPEEIRNIAGAAFDGLSVPDLRNRLAALVLDRLTDYAADPFSDALFDAYAKRSFVPGRKITVLAPGKEPVPAEALRLNRDYSLQVRLEDGREEKLASGEVSIRV
ncbi:MAG: biotin--[Clostridia bacterium]|nr:biotin--[acetyl-CoA-carboxylase] ligase [Clostridia bacterium]